VIRSHFAKAVEAKHFCEVVIYVSQSIRFTFSRNCKQAIWGYVMSSSNVYIMFTRPEVAVKRRAGQVATDCPCTSNE